MRRFKRTTKHWTCDNPKPLVSRARTSSSPMWNVKPIFRSYYHRVSYVFNLLKCVTFSIQPIEISVQPIEMCSTYFKEALVLEAFTIARTYATSHCPAKIETPIVSFPFPSPSKKQVKVLFKVYPHDNSHIPTPGNQLVSKTSSSHQY